MRSLKAIASFTLLAFFAPSASAFAASEERCAQYGREAVAAAQQWRDMGCGPTDDPRWMLDEGAHRAWCLESEDQSVNGEDQQRLVGLVACERNQYADAAVLQNSRNIQNGCGFTGVQWDGDRQHHFDWCNTGNRAQSRVDRELRESLLVQCTANK